MEVNDGSNGSKLLEVNAVGSGTLLGNRAPPKGLEPLTDWLTDFFKTLRVTRTRGAVQG